MTQPKHLSRRQFIRITATAGLMAAGGLGFGFMETRRAGVVRVDETQLLLGSIANLTIIGNDPKRARQAINAAFQRMAALEDVFSRFRPHSQLSQLNATGRLFGAHPEMRVVMAKAVEYGQLTNGAFDVTIEPVLQLYREASQRGQLPQANHLNTARQLVDYRQITITDDAITLHPPGMAVTLDGIAKGYIIDMGTAVLSDYGFDQVMVELGGDLQTRGGASSRSWQIHIQQPQENPTYHTPITAQLNDMAMATSGDYQHAFTPDNRLHHIITPKAGTSPVELASASVIARTACDADALSTAVMVMGKADGMELIEHLPATDALMIDKHGALYASSHFPMR